LIVLDASAAIDWLLHTPAGIQIDRRIYSRSESVHIPHLLDLEVAQVLRRFVREGSLSAGRAEAALQDLMDARFTRYPHWWLLPRIWRLRHNLTAYDGAYTALAELLNAPLITRDGRVSSAAGHHFDHPRRQGEFSRRPPRANRTPIEPGTGARSARAYGSDARVVLMPKSRGPLDRTACYDLSRSSR